MSKGAEPAPEAAGSWVGRAQGRRGDRWREPLPLITRRIASGRGATEQPNATGDGEAPLTPAFWAAVLVTGVASGLLGDGLMWVLFSVQHLAFDYGSGELLTALQRASDGRRVLVPLLGGLFGAGAWFAIRRWFPDETTEVDDAIWTGDGRLGLRRSLATSLVSEVVVGSGASLGREAAPKLMGGVAASALAAVARLSPAQRRLLVACGAGAGLAAVYNVPLGGAVFTAEVLCGSIALPTMLPALGCCLVATATAWIYLPDHVTYPDVPSYRLTGSILVWALVVGPALGLVSAGYTRLIGWASHHRARGASILWRFPAAMLLLGLIGTRFPELFGNGKDVALAAFLGEGSAVAWLALAVLKPAATALCLGGGGSGGLFTPTLTTGALLGAALGWVWSLAWPGSPPGAFALVGATAMMGASMQAPLAALVLVLELTGSGFGISVPMAGAVVLATAIARHIDGYSIYSARLEGGREGASVAPAPRPSGFSRRARREA